MFILLDLLVNHIDIFLFSFKFKIQEVIEIKTENNFLFLII